MQQTVNLDINMNRVTRQVLSHISSINKKVMENKVQISDSYGANKGNIMGKSWKIICK